MLAQGSTAAAALTDREREVAGLVALGIPHKQVATSLGVSIKTVETHICNIVGKIPGNGRPSIRITRFILAQHSTRAA